MIGVIDAVFECTHKNSKQENKCEAPKFGLMI